MVSSPLFFSVSIVLSDLCFPDICCTLSKCPFIFVSPLNFYLGGHDGDNKSSDDDDDDDDDVSLAAIQAAAMKAAAEAKQLDLRESMTETCSTCRGHGDLLICDGRCHRAYHAECVLNPPRHGHHGYGDDKWFCEKCTRARNGHADFGVAARGPASTARIAEIAALPVRDAPEADWFTRSGKEPVQMQNFCPTKIRCPGNQPGNRCFAATIEFATGLTGRQALQQMSREQFAMLGGNDGVGIDDIKTHLTEGYFMRKLRATKPASALQLFKLDPGMHAVVTQLDRGDKGGARLFNHWVCYDAFRRVFCSGDGDPAILSDDDCTHREAANLVFKRFKVRNILEVGVLMHVV
jgi:hypothetical protein